MTKNYASVQEAPVKVEQSFLTELEAVLPGECKAKIYPSPDGRIIKAKINTDHSLEKKVLKDLITIASQWDLPLDISRSGTGLRIVYGK